MRTTTRQWRRTALAAAATLIATLPALPAAAAPASADAASGKASLWLTDLSTDTHLAKQPSVTWKTGRASSGSSGSSGSTITVDTTRAYQPMTGFGASFTDSSAWLVGTKLDRTQRAALMRDLFSRRDGIGLNVLRQPMGASDFTVSGNYSYDDLPALPDRPRADTVHRRPRPRVHHPPAEAGPRAQPEAGRHGHPLEPAGLDEDQ